MGLKASLDEIYSSASMAARLAKREGLSAIYCLGEPGLRAELVEAGLELVEHPHDARTLVIGLLKDYNFSHLSELLACRTLERIIACNRDASYPGDGGIRHPGCGVLVAAIEAALGRSVDWVAGKPAADMLALAVAERGLRPEEVLMLGDSYEADVGLARATGALPVWLSDARCDEVLTIRRLSELQALFEVPDAEGLTRTVAEAKPEVYR
jgi:ribonucleotide monophosphatase NagD (HAD superfamily)